MRKKGVLRSLVLAGIFILFSTVIFIPDVGATEKACLDPYNVELDCIPSGADWTTYSGAGCGCCEGDYGTRAVKLSASHPDSPNKCLILGEQLACTSINIVPYNLNPRSWCGTGGRCEYQTGDLIGFYTSGLFGNGCWPEACNLGKCVASTNVCTDCGGYENTRNNVEYNACEYTPANNLTNFGASCDWKACAIRASENEDIIIPGPYTAFGVDLKADPGSGIDLEGTGDNVVGPTCGPNCQPDVCTGTNILIDYQFVGSANILPDVVHCGSDSFAIGASQECYYGFCNGNTETCSSLNSCDLSSSQCGGFSDLRCHRDNSGNWSWERSADITGTIEAACSDGVDNDCDGFIDCNVGNEDPDCGCAGSCIDNDNDDYNTTSGGGCGLVQDIDCDDSNNLTYPGAAEICDDGIDNNCNGESDWDDSTLDGFHGDVDCPIPVFSALPTDTSPVNGTSISIACTSLLANGGANSIEAYIDDGGTKRYCNFLKWTGSWALFTDCSVGITTGVKNAVCTVNQSKSYNLTGDAITQIDVQAASPEGPIGGINFCGDYTDSINCSDNPDGVGFFTGSWNRTYDGPDCGRRQNGIGCAWSGTSCSLTTEFEYDSSNPITCNDVSISCNYNPSATVCSSENKFFEVSYTRIGGPVSECTLPTRSLICPSTIALPFFGFFNIISVIVIVGLVYFFYARRKD